MRVPSPPSPALHEMVLLLRDAGGAGGAGAAAGAEEGAAGLLRGAVFYINMALWGPRRVPTLRVSFLAVLPAFLKVRVDRDSVRALREALY